MTASRLGFGSDASIASGPFDWTVTLTGDADRRRLWVHNALMRGFTRLQLRGGLTASRWFARAVGDYTGPLVASAPPDIKISFDGFDRYWMRVFFRGDFYEPEMYRLFERMKDLRRFHLIDAGANIGFWSAVLTSARFGISRAVALEASAETFAKLSRTASLCDGRFVAEHAAVTAVPGDVRFAAAMRHESRHIVTDDSANFIVVRGTTIDAVVAAHGLDQRDLIVKLDVEGAEVDAISGAARALEAGAVFIYEEHGKDPHSRVTAALRERGIACWFILDDGSLRPVATAAEASALKSSTNRGYNCLCVTAAEAAALPARLFGH